MIHYDNLIKAEKMKYYNDYETLLFARAKGKIKRVTGVLPLTFTAKGGAAADWVIYGNDENGTENLWNEEWELGIWDVNNGQKVDNLTNVRNKNKIPIESSTTYYWYNNKSDIIRFTFFDANGDYINSSIVTTKSGTVYSFTTPVNAKFFCFYYGATEYENCVTLSTTAPDHYIPYQQGVGERTENKMPTPVNGTYSTNRTTVTVTNGVYHIVQTEGSGSSFVQIDLPEFELPDSGYINFLNTKAYSLCTVALRYNNITVTPAYTLTPINRSAAIDSAYAGKKVNRIQIYATGNATIDFTTEPMITDSNTYTEYIPFGYEIPISVNGNAQTFYIGDSPLTEGETVSKTSTGVDIELFEGSNTVDTTLYNKPEMKIDYK